MKKLVAVGFDLSTVRDLADKTGIPYSLEGMLPASPEKVKK